MFDYLNSIFKKSTAKIQEKIETDMIAFVEDTINLSLPNEFKKLLTELEKEKQVLEERKKLLFFLEAYIKTKNDDGVTLKSFMENINSDWERCFDETFLTLIYAFTENKECKSKLLYEITQKRIAINRRKQGIRSDLSDSPEDIKREISSCKNMKKFLNALILGLNNCISKIDEVENSWVKLMEDYDFDK